MEKNNIKVAVIDMNNGSPNQGMRGIQEILQHYPIHLSYDIFDIRQKNEVPNLSYDIYISSGGPGSPFDGEQSKWEADFFNLLDAIEQHNTQNEIKKYAFLICHSFQLACRKYGLGTVTERKSNAFGIFPISLTENGEQETIFNGLSNPFYSVDSRDWQVVEPNLADFKAKNAKILAIEKAIISLSSSFSPFLSVENFEKIKIKLALKHQKQPDIDRKGSKSVLKRRCCVWDPKKYSNENNKLESINISGNL